MTTTTNTNANANSTNGRVRKSLAEQIDRLDGILDGLADGLNEAVVTAVKGAVGAAVQEAIRAVLTELLANPELLRQIHEPLAPAGAAGVQAAQAVGSQPSQLRAQGTLRRCWGWIRSCALGARRLLGYAANRGRHLAAAACGRACLGGRLVRRLWLPLLLAIGVGGVLGVSAYWLGPWLCTAAGGLAGFTTSLAVQASSRLRKLVGSWPAAQVR
jgi:hypothetical protein